MECPFCKSSRVQFRSKNNITLVYKYKCLNCKKIFEIKEEDMINDYMI